MSYGEHKTQKLPTSQLTEKTLPVVQWQTFICSELARFKVLVMRTAGYQNMLNDLNQIEERTKTITEQYVYKSPSFSQLSVKSSSCWEW